MGKIEVNRQALQQARQEYTQVMSAYKKTQARVSELRREIATISHIPAQAKKQAQQTAQLKSDLREAEKEARLLKIRMDRRDQKVQQLQGELFKLENQARWLEHQTQLLHAQIEREKVVLTQTQWRIKETESSLQRAQNQLADLTGFE